MHSARIPTLPDDHGPSGARLPPNGSKPREATREGHTEPDFEVERKTGGNVQVGPLWILVLSTLDSGVRSTAGPNSDPRPQAVPDAE